MKRVVIGSRGSALALWQAEHLRRLLLELDPGRNVTIQVIKTTGDKLTDVALAQIGGGKGVFVKEIEEALLRDEIDLAIHSLKDVPTELPDGLCLGAILPREDPRDVVIGPHAFASLQEIPAGARLATGSLRRTVQLRHWRPDLEIVPIRGNVDTRIRKIEEQQLDGVVLAAAGVRRLGLQDRVAYTFSLEEMVPAVGQGALAVEIRADDRAARALIAPLQHADTHRCVEAEREFLLRMGGGCQVPLGAHAEIEGTSARFSAFVADPVDGTMLRSHLDGHPSELSRLAAHASQDLLNRGARQILSQLEETSSNRPPEPAANDRRPTVLITRSAKQSGDFSRLLERGGARVLEVPTIAIQPRPDGGSSEAISRLSQYHWVVFTSANAVEIFLSQVPEPQLNKWRSADGFPAICSVGPATARALTSWQLSADLLPEVYQAEGVVNAFRKRYPDGMNGLGVLFPAAAAARRVIPEELQKLGAQVEFIPVYDTVVPPEGAAQLENALAQEPDLIVFTSSSTVQNFCAMAREAEAPRRIPCAVIGSITAETAREYGLTVAVQPAESTVPALAAAIVQFLSHR